MISCHPYHHWHQWYPIEYIQTSCHKPQVKRYDQLWYFRGLHHESLIEKASETNISKFQCGEKRYWKTRLSWVWLQLISINSRHHQWNIVMCEILVRALIKKLKHFEITSQWGSNWLKIHSIYFFIKYI